MTMPNQWGGDANGTWALIKLQRGFGYWNELEELVLDAAGDGRSSVEDNEMFVRRFYCNCDNSAGGGDNHDNDEHDSYNEGYNGNDYPDNNDNALFGANVESASERLGGDLECSSLGDIDKQQSTFKISGNDNYDNRRV